MRYEVFAGGNWHGPADLDTLNLWVGEGRIGPDTLLRQEEGGTATFAARTLKGLIFREEALHRTQFVDRGGTELRMAWLCAAVGIFGLIPCFARLLGAAPLLGIYLAWRSNAIGMRGAVVALIANVAILLLSLAGYLFLSRFW